MQGLDEGLTSYRYMKRFKVPQKNPALQTRKFLYLFFVCVIFAFFIWISNPDPQTQLNQDPIRVRTTDKNSYPARAHEFKKGHGKDK